ncbi:MAG: flavin reductase [bacterium]
MKKKEIPVEDLSVKIYDLWDHTWFLLTSGNFKDGEYNSMTVSWGSLGCMWNRPFAQVVVRPSRYTHGFITKYEHFTLCSFSEEQKQTLEYLGSVSGRDEDKISRSGLTPVSAYKVEAPVFNEAELIIECRKIYYDSMKPDKFLDPSIENEYPESDYHTIVFGEIVFVAGIEKYINK